VVSHLLGVNVYMGAGLWGFGAAVLIHRLTARHDLHADAAIGIVTTASFAIGVALMSRVHRFTQDFEALLFGNVLGVSTPDLILIAIVTTLTGLTVTALYKQLLFSAFDEAVAQVAGVPTRSVRLLFALVLALAILASMQVLGVTLIAATIVIPAATARLLTNSFSTMLWLSTGLGGATALTGMYLSYYLDIASGASIVLFAALLFVSMLGVRRQHT
jgi:manganese/iron transport system permease protein/iron/zinc/copper transport system permease protein